MPSDPTTPPTPTPVWGLWSDEQQRWWDRTYHNIFAANYAKSENDLYEELLSFRPIQLVPAGSEVAMVVGMLRERLAHAKSLATSLTVPMGMRMEQSAVFNELESIIGELQTKGG